MLGFPASTEISKQLPKARIFSEFELKASERARFDEDISRMTLVNVISRETVPGLAEGTNVSAVYVVLVALKRKEYDPKNISLLARLIPQQMVFVLQHNEEAQLAIHETRLFATSWQKFEEMEPVEMTGLSMDTLWENLVRRIGGMPSVSVSTIPLKEEIQRNIDNEKLKNKIEQLEKKCRLERQPRRKYELFNRIQSLKQNFQ